MNEGAANGKNATQSHHVWRVTKCQSIAPARIPSVSQPTPNVPKFMIYPVCFASKQYGMVAIQQQKGTLVVVVLEIAWIIVEKRPGTKMAGLAISGARCPAQNSNIPPNL